MKVVARGLVVVMTMVGGRACQEEAPKTTESYVVYGEYQKVKNVDAPTRLDIAMDPKTTKEGTPQVRCENMGGKYVKRTNVCRGVDY